MTEREQRRIQFAGFVWFWKTKREPGESSLQRFHSIYHSLSQHVSQQAESDLESSGRKWTLVRICEPGRRFLGLVRR